jgi:hypothetical protein
MGPMPCLFSRRRTCERVGGRVPLAGRVLPGEDKPSRARTSDTGKVRCDVLASSSLRIDYGPYLLGKLIGRDGGRGVMIPPGSEKLSDPLPAGVAGLERFDALDRIATSQGD